MEKSVIFEQLINIGAIIMLVSNILAKSVEDSTTLLLGTIEEVFQLKKIIKLD